MNDKHWFLYVLKLEQDKWYVGISTNIERRFKQHQKGFAGAGWTRLYKPSKIHYQEDLGICSDEQAQTYEGKVTRRYMKEYGDNNVRGGDLKDTEPYIKRFGYYWNEQSWQTVVYIVLLNLIIVGLVLDKYQ